MELLLTILGTIITILSLFFAIYSHRKNIKLINFNREQARENYHLSSEVLAAYQKLENMNIQNNDAKCIIAKGEAEARTLAKNSIKMIKRFENKYNEETIQKWAKSNRLHSGTAHIDTFKQYID